MAHDSANKLVHKCADPELQTDVDLLILDSLIHKAVEAVLAERQAQQHGKITSCNLLEISLENVESFLAIFQANHPGFVPPSDVYFRLQVLRFSTLFCRRLTQNTSTPSLAELSMLREDNEARARRWNKKRPDHLQEVREQFDMSLEIPLQLEQLQVYQHTALDALGNVPEEDERGFYGSENSTSLLDLLPPFMELTAARALLGGGFSITPRLMKLAGQFMLQACLEQYLVLGAGSGKVVEEAFAWGYVGLEDEEAPNSDFETNELLREPNEDENAMDVGDSGIASWKEVKEEHSKLLLADKGMNLVQHLEQIALEHPIADFEASVTSYLTAILQSIPAPVLVQLESNQLKGLSVEETRAFKHKVGILA